MIDLICDICKKRIVGNYKKVSNESTNAMILDGFRVDVCGKCWNAFMRCRPIELVEFPNSEED